jgi:myosin-7
MNLLDEEVRMPQGGDDKYLKKIVENQRTNSAFGGPGDPTTKGQVRPNAFLIRHYAGDVVYEVRGLVEKNADRLSRNLYDLLAGASDERTRAIFPVRSPLTLMPHPHSGQLPGCAQAQP